MVEMVLREPTFNLLTTLTIEIPLARASDAVSGKGSLTTGIEMSLGGVVSARALNWGMGGKSK